MNQQNTNRPFKGLHQDTSPIDQPKGSYTMAWNAINETSDGNNNFLSTEGSNELCGSLTPGYYPIGDVYISNNNTLIFSTNGTNSEIGIVDNDCNYSVLVNNTCLDFQLTKQIDAIYRLRRGCERTIYFTDGYNSIRYFNIDNPEQFKDDLGEWDCKLFELFLDFRNPCFESFTIIEQGSLRSGVYSFALQYLDRDLNPTKWTYITHPLPIYGIPVNAPYKDIIGSSNLDVDAMGGSGVTNKAIRLLLADLDTTYNYYRIAVIEASSFTGGVTDVVVSAPVPISQTSFTYTGNRDGYTLININDIRIQPDDIQTAEHIEQLENRLILANTKGKQINFCEFQSYASQISSKYTVKPAPANANPVDTFGRDISIGAGNSKDPATYWFARGYMGDEVYAFGIVYVFKDGYESPAYHIPGTGLDPITCGEEECVSGEVTNNCIRILESPITGGVSCLGTPTEYTVNYKLDGVQQTFSRTIVDENDVQGWVEVYCGSETITDLEVIVVNNDCTGVVDEFPLIEYFADISPTADPLWFTPIECGLTGSGFYPYFGVYFYARERRTTTCVAGLPVAPPGLGWSLLLDDCVGTNTSIWVRKALAYDPALPCDVPYFVQTFCTGIGCTPQTPWEAGYTGINTSQNWHNVYSIATLLGGIGLWVNYDYLLPNGVELTTFTYNVLCPNEIITTWTDNIAHIFPDEAAYNALPDEQKLKNWQVYNTAVPINSNSGYMSYWQSPNSVYPELLDCEENDYWGVDVCGNPLAGNPIRHHKFPDRNLIPHIVATSLQQAFESTLIITIQYTGTPAQLAALLVPQFVGDTNPSELLQVDYDLDGVAQPSIIIRLFNNDFIYDSIANTYALIYRTVTTRIGTSLTGIDNVVFSDVIGTDVNTTVLNASVTNGVEISPTTDLEVNTLGIQFDNIVYPHPDIVGHYIVRGDRDAVNRTVVEKGFSNSTHESSAKGTNFNLFSYFAGGASTPLGFINNQSSQYNYLFTPELLFANNPPNGVYMKREQVFAHSNTWGMGNNSTAEEFDGMFEFGAGVGQSAVFGTGYATLSTIRKLTYAGVLAPTEPVLIRAINKSVVLNALTRDEQFIPNRILYNVSQTNKVQIVELALPGINSAHTKNIPYVSIKIDRDIHPNLFAIDYRRTHNCVLTNDNPSIVYGGDIVIAPLEIGNTMFYQFNDSVWDTVLYFWIISSLIFVTIITYGAATPALAGAISAITAGAVAGVAATAISSAILIGALIAGSIAVTALTIEQVMKSMKEEGLQEVITEDGQMQDLSFSTKNFMEYASEFVAGIYIETTINTGLRQDHLIYNPGQHFRDQSHIATYFRDKIVMYDETATEKKDLWVRRGFVIPEVYQYNPDYSRQNTDNVYNSLPESYNCCSNCLESHPNRVAYSEQSFQEEAIDNYRVFLINNYRDIEAEKGVITNLFRKHNNLFIHTEEALWQLPQSIQERITGDLISFIGTGEYFSIPPRLVLDDDIGSAGSKHKWATIKTDVGVFFVDESKRAIFLFGEGMQALSNEGMKNFFKENLVSWLGNQFYNLTGSVFPNLNNHANPNGVGYKTVYDTRHNRLILTKRDYLILPDYRETFTVLTSIDNVIIGVEIDDLFYDTTTQQFGIVTGEDEDSVLLYEYITLGDPLYFENKSWTISYSLLNNTWTSFHSYIPLYYFYIQNKFYSMIDHEIWKHNRIDQFRRYYGTLYPHIIEYVSLSTPLATRLWEELMLHTIGRTWDSSTEEYTDVDITFNKAIFYNSKQCTGLLTLVVKNNTTADYLLNQIKNNANQIILDRNERNWTLNEIRDYRVNYAVSIWSKNWSSVQSEFPIDKVLNTSAIDFAKDWQQLQQLRDKYLIVRLIFDNFDDVNLITNYSLERETLSPR